MSEAHGFGKRRGVRVEEFAFAEMPHVRDALSDIRRGELDAVIVHGLYGSETLQRVVEVSEARFSSLPSQLIPCDGVEACRILGHCLDMADFVGDGLTTYFEAVAPMEAHLAEVFDDAPFTQRVGAVLGALAGGAAEVLVHPDGRRYCGATIRRVPPGGRIPLHCEDEKLRQPSKAHLSAVMERPLMSFYMMLEPPDEGGELVLYDVRWGDLEPHVRGKFEDRPLPVYDLLGDLRRYDPRTFRLPPGSLILHGNACFHEVLPVQGARTRWTIGGFAGFTPDGLRFWS